MKIKIKKKTLQVEIKWQLNFDHSLLLVYKIYDKPGHFTRNLECLTAFCANVFLMALLSISNVLIHIKTLVSNRLMAFMQK